MSSLYLLPSHSSSSSSIPFLTSESQPPSLFSFGFGSVGFKNKRSSAGVVYARWTATSKVYKEITKQEKALSKFKEAVIQDTEIREATNLKVTRYSEWIEAIRSMLNSMEDGEITVSAYDTAWVALVEDIHGSGGPQFPSSIQWIVENQLADGSWGDDHIFSAHDRILNTLGCVVALKKWNIHLEKCQKGLSFIRQNMNKLEDEDAEHMPIGFEVAFPSLIEIARKLDLDIPYDSPVMQEIYAQRNLKLTKIPMDMVHMLPTTLLHSLEGMEGLDWEKMMKLQSADGSFLFSPASTAFALMNTKDEKCLEYLRKPIERFNGGVPNVYPVDLFEHLWAVDRLERLGISRYFQSEIKNCVNYVSRYWTEDGIAWARNTNVHDIDDTAMGFRILRLHGYDVSPDVFRHFEKNSEFFCFAGQSNQAITGIYNLYRAAQISFPGEKILENAKSFAYKFLREKQATNQLLDKWIMTKDLPGEVRYALDIPWYKSLPRIETRYYLEQYGGKGDTWIGKTLYRMSYVNNDTYLELAKLDFNNCQAVHQMEWKIIQRWYRECNLREFGVTNTTLLNTYFVAAASIFEPEKSTERLAWTKIALLMEAVRLHFEHNKQASRWWNWRSNNTTNTLVRVLLETLKCISVDTFKVTGKDVRDSLQQCIEKWLVLEEEDDDKAYSDGAAAEVLVTVISLCGGHSVSEEVLSHPQYKHLVNLTNNICYQLSRTHKTKDVGKNGAAINGRSTNGVAVNGRSTNGVAVNGRSTNGATTISIESNMQELVQIVLQKRDGINSEIKENFLTVVKSFFYMASCTQGIMDHHIAEVLFKSVN